MSSMNEFMSNLRSLIHGEMSNIHTAIQGTILTYSPGNNRASVQPIGKFKTDDGRAIDYPVIANVPICFPTGMGGKAGVTFPIQSGDGCLLIFSESQTEDFLSGGDSEDTRRFSLNDAVCIPGLYSGSTAASVSNPNDVCLSNGNSKVSLGADGLRGMTVDGTNFSFSGGDLVVNGISLTKHTHPGCQGGSTGQPQ